MTQAGQARSHYRCCKVTLHFKNHEIQWLEAGMPPACPTTTQCCFKSCQLAGQLASCRWLLGPGHHARFGVSLKMTANAKFNSNAEHS